MLLMDTQVNIQQWYQVFFHSLHLSDIIYCIISGIQSEYTTVVPIIVPGSPPTILCPSLQINTTKNIKYSHYIIFFQ